jgi:hypothetical protein
MCRAIHFRSLIGVLVLVAAAAALIGCDLVQIRTQPQRGATERQGSSSESSSEPSESSSGTKPKPGAKKKGKSNKPVTLRDKLLEQSWACSFVELPGIGKTTSTRYLETAQRELDFYLKYQNDGPGARLPADVTLLLLRSFLYDVHEFSGGMHADPDAAYQAALDFLDSALPKITDLPTDLIKSDPVSSKFCGVATASAGLVMAVHSGQWGTLDERVATIERANAEYERVDGHASPRGQALVAEAHAIQEKYAGAATAYKTMVDAMEHDATINNLTSQKNEAMAQADVLRDRLGLGGYDDGCDKQSVDPVTQARLTKLCPLARREFALNKQIDQIQQQRYWIPFSKKYPSPDRPDPGKKAHP